MLTEASAGVVEGDLERDREFDTRADMAQDRLDGIKARRLGQS